MLLSLLYLEDSEIELVTLAVHEWCRLHLCDVDSSEGRRALTMAIDLVQSRHSERSLLPELTGCLAPPSDMAACIVKDISQDMSRAV